MSFLVTLAIFMLILRATPAIVKRIERGNVDPAAADRIDELERKLGEVEENLRTLGAAADGRLVDLEERQDVTERVLQRVKDTKALPRG